MSIKLVMPTNHLILCHPLLFLPSIFLSIKVFSNESALRITWPKYWSCSFSISPSNEHSGLISFRMDCGLVGSLCSPRDSLESYPTPQFKSISFLALSFLHNSLSSNFQQLPTQLSSNSHIHTWPLEKTIALTRWTCDGKVMSLLFNILSRLVITFLPRSKPLLISWLQSPSAVILQPPQK